MYISKLKWCELGNFYFGRHICYVLRSERFSIYQFYRVINVLLKVPKYSYGNNQFCFGISMETVGKW